MTATKSPSKSARDEAERIVRAKGGLCLVPKENSEHGMTCHERTFCDCHVETILEKAIEKAEKRGVIRGLRMAADKVQNSPHGGSGRQLNMQGFLADGLRTLADRLEKELTESGEGSE